MFFSISEKLTEEYLLAGGFYIAQLYRWIGLAETNETGTL